MLQLHMATKTVALDDEAYQLLRRLKKGDESFSAAVKRLVRPRRRLTEFAGIWKDLTPRERRALEKAYEDLRAGDARRAQRLRALWE